MSVIDDDPPDRVPLNNPDKITQIPCEMLHFFRDTVYRIKVQMYGNDQEAVDNGKARYIFILRWKAKIFKIKESK